MFNTPLGCMTSCGTNNHDKPYTSVNYVKDFAAALSPHSWLIL